MADSAISSARTLIEYAKQIPRPLGFDGSIAAWKDWGVEVVSVLTNQWNRILHSPIGLGPSHMTSSVRVVEQRLARTAGAF